MSTEDSLPSKILTNVKIIGEIYKLVSIAGFNTLQLDTVKSASTDVNIVKPNIKGITRRTANCRGITQFKIRNASNKDLCIKSDKYQISYNENDIMILGGAALNIYDYLLRDYKDKRGIAAMEQYIKKKTSDIDITWWPRLVSKISSPSVHIEDEIVVSSSYAIEILVREFKSELEKQFTNKDNIELVKSYIKQHITNISNDDKVNVRIEWIPIYPAGVHKLEISFIVKGIDINLVDISIHDSGASQRFDLDGKEIIALYPMTKDPVYCSPFNIDKPTINSIHAFPIQINNNTSIIVKIPSIYSFVEQQMFAFDNLIRLGELKGFINLKRVEYIRLLLEKWQNENEDYKYIIGTNINAALLHLNEREGYSLNKYKHKRIEELNKLYNEFDRIYQLTRDQKYKKYKSTMYELRKTIDDLRSKYSQIKPYEIIDITNITKSIQNSGEITEILDEKDKIDKEIKKVQIGNNKKQDVRITTTLPVSSRPPQPPQPPHPPHPPHPPQSQMVYYNRPLYTPPLPPSPPPSPPQSPHHIAFNSVQIDTSSIGIPILMTSEGIKWYINPDNGKLIRFNPLFQRWEEPKKRNPMDGLPRIEILSDGHRYLRDIYTGNLFRFNHYTYNWDLIPPRPPAQPMYYYTPAPHYDHSYRRGGRNITIKRKSRTNATHKK